MEKRPHAVEADSLEMVASEKRPMRYLRAGRTALCAVEVRGGHAADPHQ